MCAISRRYIGSWNRLEGRSTVALVSLQGGHAVLLPSSRQRQRLLAEAGTDQERTLFLVLTISRQSCVAAVSTGT